ncbi:hypothetical protein LTR95_010041 [Oleoguttula sp. CCFEE 5521]
MWGPKRRDSAKSGTRLPIGSTGLDTTDPAKKKRKTTLPERVSDVESFELAALAMSHLSKVPEEVLEMILFELPMLDLFVVQSVSQSIRDSIATSPRIQGKMWLRVQSRPNETWIVSQNSDGLLECKLQTYIFPDSVAAAAACPAGAQLVKPARLNPLLRKGTYDLELQHLGSSTEWMASLAWHGMNFDRISKLSGTWRNMHVTDVPCTRAFVAAQYGWRHRRRSRRDALVAPTRLVRDVNTITMGMLVDAVLNTQTFVSVRLPRSVYMVHYETLAQVLQRLRAEHPGTFTFDLERSKIFLTGIAVPTEDMWQAVWNKAVEDQAAQALTDASTS